MKIRLVSLVNAPDKNYLPYFTEHVDKYQAFKRGEIVSFPEYVVEALKRVSVIDESPSDGASIVEEVSDVSASVGEEVIPEVLDDPVAEGESVDYFSELINLERVGQSTANDIMEVYPERGVLIQALTDGIVSEFPPQILSKLEEFYLA